MYIYVAPRRKELKEKEVQDFRAVAERLVKSLGFWHLVFPHYS